MAALAGTMLTWPGTVLDRLWFLNEPAHMAMAPIGRLIGPVFLVFSAILALTSIGWFKQRLWAWRMAIVVISAQLVGDFVNLFRGDLLRGSFGVVIAGALLFVLLRSSLRMNFQDGILR